MNPDVKYHPTDREINEALHERYPDGTPGLNEPEAPRVSDPLTKREWAHRLGECPKCGKHTTLFMRVSKRDWRCGDCIPQGMRVLV